MEHKRHLIFRFTSALVTAALLASALVFAIPSGTAAAQGEQPPAGEAQAESPGQRLEQAYQRERTAHNVQGERLAAAGERLTRLEARIAEWKAKGKDTAVLEEAAAEYKTELDAARKLHEESGDILTAHEGFDASGKVVDVEQAHDTVQAAGDLLREVRQDLRKASRELARAVRQFIRQNR